jgi:hypothetical protein
MLEQWQADRLLSMPKIYVETTIVDLSPGADGLYILESDDGNENFLLDISRGRINKAKAKFQLRYSRDVVLSRMCTSVPHTNPDGTFLTFPHYHRYKEEFGDKFAEQIDPFDDITSALHFFCGQINLPQPDIQGGILWASTRISSQAHTYRG